MVTGATILLADDDRAIRTVIGRALTLQGHKVRSAADASTLWDWVESGEGDLVITDVVMPDANGLDLVPRIRARRPDLPVIVVSAQSTLQTAVRASEREVFEYLPKPFDLADLTAAVERALTAPPAAPAAVAPAPDEPEDRRGLPLIGRSPAMQEVYRVVARLMSTDLTVLITGESGTGKELVARALHEYGRRSAGPFVAINMAAIPRELVEAELFGHERGAFTGATARGTGRFEQAQGGTLFLDEIGDMPTEAQTRLLRVLQEGEFTTIGGRTPIRADVRIIAATHRDLRRLVAQGRFREDLFYRINVVPIRLPALRDRPEDIPELVEHFLRRAAAEGMPLKRLDAEALAALAEYDWPGNVRELENLIRRIVALQPLDVISRDVVVREIEAESGTGTAEPIDNDNLGAAVSGHLGRYFAAHAPGLPPPGLHLRVLREIERPLVTLALVATKGNQIKAAALLGLNRNTLRKKIRDLDIEVVRGIK